MEESIVKVEHLSHRYSVQWAIKDTSRLKTKVLSVCWGQTVPENPPR